MIRLATETDLDAVLQLGARFHQAEGYARFFPFNPAAVRIVLGFALEHGVIVVAEQAGWIVGALVLVAVPHLLSGESCADEVGWFVEPDYRGGSIGPRLHRAAEVWCCQHQIRLIKMVAPDGDDTLRAYYRHMGYQPVETGFLKRLA